jgi:hypothetical protein
MKQLLSSWYKAKHGTMRTSNISLKEYKFHHQYFFEEGLDAQILGQGKGVGGRIYFLGHQLIHAGSIARIN